MKPSVEGLRSDLRERLRRRAKRYHRVLRDRLQHILDDAAHPRCCAEKNLERLKALDLSTPGESMRTTRGAREDV